MHFAYLMITLEIAVVAVVAQISGFWATKAAVKEFVKKIL
jgi:hypothetical protein